MAKPHRSETRGFIPDESSRLEAESRTIIESQHPSLTEAGQHNHTSEEDTNRAAIEKAVPVVTRELKMILDDVPLDWVAKQIVLADHDMQREIAAHLYEQAQTQHREIAKLDDSAWSQAIDAVVDARLAELTDAGIETDIEGTVVQDPEGNRRLSEAENMAVREFQFLKAIQEGLSTDAELREALREAAPKVDEAFEHLVNESQSLDHLDYSNRRALLTDPILRKDITRTFLETAQRNGTPFSIDSLDATDWSNALFSAAQKRIKQLEKSGIRLNREGDLLEGNRALTPREHAEVINIQTLLEVESAAEGTLKPVTRVRERSKISPSAQTEPRPPRRTSSVWNRIGSRVGKFLAGVGIWLGGTSGGDFDQSSQVAAREQAPDRPLPTYARSERAAAQEMPSESITFSEEESNRVMNEGTRPTEMVFSDEEGMEVEEDFTNVMKEQVASAVKLADVRNRNFDRLTVEQQEAPTAEQESRLERADIEAQAPRRSTTKRPVEVKRSASSKFDAASFTAAGKDALRGVVGTPEGTQRRLEAMRAGKRPLPTEAEAALDAVQEYVQTVTKPKTEVSPNKGGAANELLKTVPKAPEKRRTIAKYKLSTARLAQERAAGGEVTDGMQELKDAVEKDVKSGELKAEEGKKLLEEIDNITKPAARKVVEQPTVYRKPTSLSRAPKTSRGLEAIRASRAENKKSLDAIDQQIEEVRAAQKRGEIGLRDALLQINALKDLK